MKEWERRTIPTPTTIWHRELGVTDLQLPSYSRTGNSGRGGRHFSPNCVGKTQLHLSSKESLLH